MLNIIKNTITQSMHHPHLIKFIQLENEETSGYFCTGIFGITDSYINLQHLRLCTDFTENEHLKKIIFTIKIKKIEGRK